MLKITTFEEIYKLHGQITRELLRLRTQNFKVLFLYEHKQGDKKRDFQICISIPLTS